MKVIFSLSLALLTLACSTTTKDHYDPTLVRKAIESMRRLDAALNEKAPAQKPQELLSEVETDIVQALGKAESARLADSLRRALEKYQNAVSLWSRTSDSRRAIQETERKAEGYLEIYKRAPSDRISKELEDLIAMKERQKKESADLNRQFQEMLGQARNEAAIIDSIIE